MSYDAQPEWTNDIEIDVSSFPHQHCPTCGEMFGNVGEVRECMFEHGYYEPQHIPKRLVFTCFNPTCKDCDIDFEVNVSVRIHFDKPVEAKQ